MKDSKNIVIGLLCTVLCVMAVAYAAFSTSLSIEGTASVSSTWGVAIETISCTPTAGTTGATAPTYEIGGEGSTAMTLGVSLNQPGDKVACTVRIKNTGTLEAKLSSIEVTNGENTSNGGTVASDFIWVTAGKSGDSAVNGAVLAASADARNTYSIDVEYKDIKVNGQSVAIPQGQNSRVVTVKFNYVQNLTAAN